jgi:phosphatidylglycerophosphatase A
MTIAHVFKYIATLGPLGYLSAPGTLASLVTLPVVYQLQRLIPTQFDYAKMFLGAFVIGWIVIYQALKEFKRYDDPPEIVIDECVGCLIVFWGIPFSASVAIIGFVLFRFFDIAKIAGIRYCERLSGPWGIMLDDVWAALLTNLILRIVFFNLIPL